MSHGEENAIYARDVTYPIPTLWEHFTADNCPSLAGKPKLFFIQVGKLRFICENKVNFAVLLDQTEAGMSQWIQK